MVEHQYIFPGPSRKCYSTCKASINGERRITMDTVQWGRGMLTWKQYTGVWGITMETTMRERGITLDTATGERRSTKRGMLPQRLYNGVRGITMETVQWGKVPLPSIQQWEREVLPWIQYNGREGCYQGDSTMEVGALPWKQYNGRKLHHHQYSNPSIQQWWRVMLPWRHHIGREGCQNGDSTMGKRGVTFN